MERIGIFGGSFNPVHCEHIKVATESIKELQLDKLFIIPTFVAPHKQGEKVLPSTDRLNLLNLAFNDDKKVIVSDYEIQKQGVSYSYLTIRHFKELYPSATLYFLMGSDMLENFPTWKNPEDIVKNCNLVLINRQGNAVKDERLISNVKTLYNHEVIKLNVSGKDVSSTEIRLRKMLGLSLDGLVTKEVFEYIENNDLFKPNKYYEYIKTNLPEKRKTHVLGVILTALKIAKNFEIDKTKVELAALLHDCAKYIAIEEYEKEKYGVPLNCPSQVAHQYVGAYIAKNVLGITDEEVLNAIRYHTSGRANMTLLEKIIYTADIIEPSRRFLGVDELRKEVDNDFDKGFKVCVSEILEFLQNSGDEIYPLSIDACNFYK